MWLIELFIVANVLCVETSYLILKFMLVRKSWRLKSDFSGHKKKKKQTMTLSSDVPTFKQIERTTTPHASFLLALIRFNL